MIPLLLALAAVPSVAPVKVFGDWAVACDNGNRCEAVSMTPGDGNASGIGLLLRRVAGQAGTVSIELRSAEGLAGPVTFRVDGKVLAAGRLDHDGMLWLTGGDAEAVAAALPTANLMILTGIGGTRIGAISMKGSAATLRYIDAAQGRAGGVTALAAKGMAPASIVPAPAALPVVIAPSPDPAPVAIPPALITRMRDQAKCPADPATGPVSADAQGLGGGAALVLLSCGSGAYNFTTTPFVVSGGRAMPAPFDDKPVFGELDSAVTLVNPVWNAGAGTISSYAKGRGIGDCGISQTYVWDGSRFRLVERKELGDCRGAIAWPTSWRATVRHR